MAEIVCYGKKLGRVDGQGVLGWAWGLDSCIVKNISKRDKSKKLKKV